MTLFISMIRKYTPLLQEVGLSAAQAEVYEVLVTQGQMTAGRLKRLTSLERGMVYVALKQLGEMELVEKHLSKGKPDQFTACHPSLLQRIVDAKKQAALAASASFESVVHQLKVDFESLTGQPGVRFYMGTDGLQEMYNDLNASGNKSIDLIRSSRFDTTDEESVADIVKRQVMKQISLGIQVRIITPLLPETAYYLSLDETYKNTQRRIIPREVFETSSQILLYGNKVAITTYRQPMMTTIVDHADVADTYRALFNYIWRASRGESDEIVKKLKNDVAEM